ncbi:MAG TPA: hypothetical protein VD838_21235 [Anaeromyxobacteraceae bacterium]|nr:hypothetical protein [Anaeromyxobacteraceae bacterium]
MQAILDAEGLTLADKRIAIVKLAKLNAAALADREGVSPQAVRQVIRGTARSDRLERAVAKAIGIPHARLFDEPTRAPQRREA